MRRRGRFITQADIDEAILKVQMGPEKKSKVMSPKAKKLTAYHEAGHAIAGKYLEHTDPVHYITIIPRGRAGGFTLFRPKEDLEDFSSREELFEISSCRSAAAWPKGSSSTISPPAPPGIYSSRAASPAPW